VTPKNNLTTFISEEHYSLVLDCPFGSLSILSVISVKISATKLTQKSKMKHYKKKQKQRDWRFPILAAFALS